MNYKLAKKLKEAGFPMPDNAKVWCVMKDYPETVTDLAYTEVELPQETESMFIPTLSELIDACGDNTSLIRFNPKKYQTINTNTQGKILQFFGKTPEEAVAKLWLKLNGVEL